ncbi:hypothetical protein FKM82_013636 [Ascaphus truei]
MRNRKLTDGVRCSARQKNRNCSTAQSSSDQEAEICRSTKSVCLAISNKTTDKRPSKKMKCDQNSLVKSDMHGLLCESGDAPFVGSSTETTCDHRHSAQTIIVPKNKGRRCQKLRIDTHTSTCPLPGINDYSSCYGQTDDSGDGTVFADITKRTKEKESVHLDSSPFIDEDSNQPMPLGRFFENAELMQDLPPVVPASASMSRREFRKLHFRAKDDEDDDYINEDNA